MTTGNSMNKPSELGTTRPVSTRTWIVLPVVLLITGLLLSGGYIFFISQRFTWPFLGLAIGYALMAIFNLPAIQQARAGKVPLRQIGLVSAMFAEMIHGIHHIFKRSIAIPFLRPVIGGLIVIGLVYLLGTRDYLGLGAGSHDPAAVTILSCFSPQGAHPWSWWWKLLFTAVTLGSGFKGGEVTPLFFIGAALGNTLGQLLGAPVDLFAGLGFIAVFAGAANTPLACTLMGIELFGSQYTLYFTIACFLSYLLSGHSGIYLSQRIGTPKLDREHLPLGDSLRATRELRPGWGAYLARRRTKAAATAERDTQTEVD